MASDRPDPTATPGEGRPLTDRLVSPNGFDGSGPVPDKVNEAARTLARLRVKFVNQWMPGADALLTVREVDDLFIAAAIRAEWERELYEARDALATENQAMRAERDELVEQLTVWKAAWAQLARNQIGPIAASLPPVANRITGSTLCRCGHAATAHEAFTDDCAACVCQQFVPPVADERTEG